MKMSKSIKDYKDAMDSVKISESFYKRTEILLNESSEMEVVKSHPSKIKLFTRSATAVAACLLVAFGIKMIVDNRTETDSAVVTEIHVQETTIVTVPVTVSETASPVIDRPEDDVFIGDSGVMIDNMPDIPDIEEDAVEDYVTAPIEEESDDSDVVESEDDADAAPLMTSSETTVTTAETAEREGYPQMAEPQGADNIPPLYKINSSESVEITPYFDMGSIKSGENPVSGSGDEFSELLSVISAVTEVSPVSENEAFKSLFLIKISEQSSGLTYYSIYVTDTSTIVVTRHDAVNQKRITYQPSASDYDKILLLLYTNFGNANEFNYFRVTQVVS